MPTDTENPPAAAAPAAETPAPPETPQAPAPQIEGEKQDGAQAARTAFMEDKDFWSNIMGKPPEEPKPAEDEAKGDAKDEKLKADHKPETEKPKKGKTEKPEKKTEPEPKRIIKKREAADDQRIIEASATAAVQAAISAMPKPAAAQQPAATDDTEALLARLDDDAREDARVLIEMERLNPQKNAGLFKKFVDYRGKEADYIRKWERENPGQKFDREHESHNPFYDENEPIISDGERKKAEREIIRREAREEAERAVAPIRERAEAEEKQRQIAPTIQNVEGNALGFMLTTMKPEADEVLRESGGYAKLKESDPELVETAEEVFEKVRPLLNETVRIFGGVARPDPTNNPVHKAIIDTVLALETQIGSRPIRDRVREDGKVFSPRHAFVQMTPAEQNKHWVVEQGDVLTAIAQSSATAASEIYKKDIERHERYAARKGMASKTPPKPSAQTPAAPQSKPGNGEVSRPSPSGAGRIQVDTNQPKADDNQDSFMKYFGTGTRPH